MIEKKDNKKEIQQEQEENTNVMKINKTKNNTQPAWTRRDNAIYI